ncbi:MAG: 2Fe-2S iron-sulfur cluster-binding protein [Betaproteobacteria bacterium]
MEQLRQAFTAEHAVQCGYCTPGMLITAYDIVTRLLGADEARVREELAANLCRCTGYVGYRARHNESPRRATLTRCAIYSLRRATPGYLRRYYDAVCIGQSPHYARFNLA